MSSLPIGKMWNLILITPIFNTDKTVTSAEVIIRDITKEKEAQTKKIEDNAKALEDQQKVILNILEDVEEEKEVAIRDNGYGIPKKEQKNIFTKLFRADNIKGKDTTGTGLGLYIAKSIIEKFSGGKIWFKSAENKGTTFYFTIPLTGMKKKTGSKVLS